VKNFPGDARTHAIHDHIRDEAIGWLIGFCEQEIDADGRGRFERWLKASPAHVQAYLQISALWEAADRLNRTNALQIDEIVQRAAAEPSVVKLQPAADRLRPVGATRVGRGIAHGRAALAASLVVLTFSAIAAFWWQSHRSLVYATSVGEERTIALADSSTVVLDARTKIRVRYTKSLRTVELLGGQALFRVMHNPARPFIVTAGQATIRDVGTQFDVRRDGAVTTVTVLQGRVTTGGVYVSAGQRVVVAPRLTLRPVRVNARLATAWMEGKLVFDATPLSDVIQAFNRYSLKPLTIDDPQLLALHVSGTFDARDSAQIVQFLTQRFGLVAHESANGIRLARH
jgi:transmembrane sensor